jgi:hypothetical protein
VRSCLQFGHADCWTAGRKRRTVAFVSFRRLLAVGVAVLGTFATACTDDSEDAVPLTTTSAVATTTTRAPTTSTTLDFETEVKLAALELLEIRNEVFQNPDVSRVSEYISEFCTCLERELGIVQEFVQNGRRWTGPAVEPLGIRLDSDDARGPSLTLIARQPAGSIAGPAGTVPVAEVELAPYVVSLVAEAPGAWRINGLEGITLERDAALQIIEHEGLP